MGSRQGNGFEDAGHLAESERDAFRSAAHAALSTQEVVEYMAHRQLSGEPLRPETINRVTETIKPTAKVMWDIYQRTGNLPRLRFRVFIFTMTIAPGDILDIQFFRESDIMNVE